MAGFFATAGTPDEEKTNERKKTMKEIDCLSN
jgi:hypothetical protein